MEEEPRMELTLVPQAGTQVHVICDGQPSHIFELLTLFPGEKGTPQPLDDPVGYGQAVYHALFPPDTAARHELDAMPERILLVTTDDTIDAVPWEYAYGLYGADDIENFLVLSCHFVRGIPFDQRISPPTLENSLHVVAIPSNPLEKELPPLDIDAEWMRLKEIINGVPYTISLERTRPPTIEQVRRLVANQHNRVVQFMGHGGQHETGAILCFEKDNGELHPVTAREFVMRVRGSVFLVTLNACVSATPGPTNFSNLASALVRQKTPYALGMRLSIHDDDARSFSRSFYGELASGVSIEEALFQARLTLANSPRSWVIGVPVLYTALATPATGFTSIDGAPIVKEHQPQIEVSALPRAEGAFQGRIDELKQLGDLLTGDHRSRIVTIHGSGGQGKTALAREAVERFAYAWPGGVWATTLENLPSREVFVNDLAPFLGVAMQEIHDPAEIERQVLRQLNQRRTLIVLDNAETLVEAVKANDEAAIWLARLLREHLSSPLVSLLITTREFLGWDGEVGLKRDLEGLAPEDGASLFRQAAPQRMSDAELALAEELSRKVEGHPLSLRLLGGAFNESAISLPAFVKDCEVHLIQAENKYVGTEHRHRTLYASIDTSVRYLDTGLADLFRKLWLFHAPFLPETAVAIFDPQTEYAEGERSPIYDRLYLLWRRGLLSRETFTVCDGPLEFYQLLPTMRPYVEQHLEHAYERETLLMRFGNVYSQLANILYHTLDSSATAIVIARQAREDLEQGLSNVLGLEQGYYLLYWARILQRLGSPRSGLGLLEQALEIAQGQDRHLEWQVSNNMAVLYHDIGQLQEALILHEQALPIIREVGDRRGEVATLINMAQVYQSTGQPQRAQFLYEQALSITREVEDRRGEAATLSSMAGVCQSSGQPQRAQILYEQALPIWSEVGDRLGEAFALSNLAEVYQSMGQLQEAQSLYEQALTIQREVGDQKGEAATLNSMAQLYQGTGHLQEALSLHKQSLHIIRESGDRRREAISLGDLAGVYQSMGQLQEALSLREQALSILREVDDQSGEAVALSNLAGVYQSMGQLQEALSLYEQILPIIREMGDRKEEAAILNNIAYLFQSMYRYTEALVAFEQSIALERQVVHPAGEAAGLAGLALLLHLELNRTEDAIGYMEQAIAVLVETGLPQDATRQTVDELRDFLQMMYSEVSPSADIDNSAPMPSAMIQQFVTNTVAVMTNLQDRHAEWSKAISKVLHEAQQRGADWQVEVDFLTAILDVLGGQSPNIPIDHPYAQALAAIQDGIASGGLLNYDDPDV